MNKFWNKSKAVVFLLLASLFAGQAMTASPLTTQAQTGPVSITTEVSNLTKDTAYLPQVNATANDEVSLRIFIKNQTEQTLTGINLKAQLDPMLEYIPGETTMERLTGEYITLSDSIVTAQGVTINQEFQALQGAAIWIVAKVKPGATGTLNQTSTVIVNGQSNSSSTAKVVIGSSEAVNPRLVVNTLGANLGQNANPGENPSGGWKNRVEAKRGDIISIAIQAYNDRPADANSILKDVMVQSRIDKHDEKVFINGKAKAGNHAQVVDPLRIDTGFKNRFDYVTGSARAQYKDPSGDWVSYQLPDGVMAEGVTVNDIGPGGSEAGAWVIFQVRVRDPKEDGGTIIIEKHLRKNGEWVQEPHADKQFTFKVHGPEGVTEAKTNDQGTVTLTEMPFGEYRIEEVQRDGYELVFSNNTEFILGKDQKVQKALFKNAEIVTPPTPKGNLKVVKFIDTDGDGVRDANEGPHAGVSFEVTGPNGFEFTAQTNAEGRIELNNLTPGNYTATETVPAGYRVTTANPQTGEVKANETAILTFGNQPVEQPKGNLTVIKFIDTDGDGVRDAGEQPHANVTFTITGPNGFSLTAQTNAEGRIEARDLALGNYTVTETVPSGYRVTTANPQTGEVKANETATLTFGNQEVVIPPAKGNLTVIKFIDTDGDGVRDANEGPHAGVSFTVTGPNGFNQSHQTNAEGKIELRDLTLGNYTVTETVPAGYRVTTANPQTGEVKANETAILTFGNQVVTPSIPGAPGLQIAKFVGNATRNEATDKHETKAFAGEVLNWRVVVKNTGNDTLKTLRLNDMLPANVKVEGQIVITNPAGQKFRFADFTQEFVTVGDLTPNQEVTIEFATVTSRDLACNAELVNTAFAEAANHVKVQAQAKAVIECVPVAAAKQPPLVRTGNEQALLSMVLSLLSVAGYAYSRQRKQLAKMFGQL